MLVLAKRTEVPNAPTDPRLQGVRRAVPAPPPARPRGGGRGRRVRLGLDQRPLPALATHRRSCPQRPGLAGRRDPGDPAGDAGHERAHAVLPVQPGHRCPGVRHPGLSRPRPGDPGRRHRGVDERGPGRRGLARAEGAVRASQGGGDPHRPAVARGVRRLQRRVLPHPRGDRLRPPGHPRADLHRGLGSGRGEARRADLRMASSAPAARVPSCTPTPCCRRSPRGPRRWAGTPRRWTG